MIINDIKRKLQITYTASNCLFMVTKGGAEIFNIEGLTLDASLNFFFQYFYKDETKL